MRLNLTIIILIVIAFMTSCQSQTTPSNTPSVVKPSISGLTTLEIDEPAADSIRQHISPFLESNAYTEYEAGNQLLLYVVSSGEFDQAEITLSSGETYQVDVLYAYALMNSKRVLIVPVLFGLDLPDGHYAYFSEKYALESGVSVTTTSTDRETALANARVRLPRGRIFRLLAYGMATRDGLDWKKCPSVLLYPPEICPVGCWWSSYIPTKRNPS